MQTWKLNCRYSRDATKANGYREVCLQHVSCSVLFAGGGSQPVPARAAAELRSRGARAGGAGSHCACAAAAWQDLQPMET